MSRRMALLRGAFLGGLFTRAIPWDGQLGCGKCTKATKPLCLSFLRVSDSDATASPLRNLSLTDHGSLRD